MVENKNESMPILDKTLNIEKYSTLDWLTLYQWIPQDGTKQAKREKQFKS
jgi:hypothetical protein